MVNLEVKTKLSTSEVVSKLKNFFGKGGLGLDLTEEAPLCLNFEGGGGYVNATLCKEEDGKTKINLTGREWEYQIKEFSANLK